MSITLVAGLSSSGKSTYIDQAGCRPLVIASEVSHSDEVADGAFLHYSTLRYSSRRFRTPRNSFRDDPLLDTLLHSGRPFEVRYIFCSKPNLLARIARRTSVEAGQGAYPSADFAARVKGLDYQNFHASWLTFFARTAQHLALFHAHHGAFAATSVEDAQAILAGH